MVGISPAYARRSLIFLTLFLHLSAEAEVHGKLPTTTVLIAKDVKVEAELAYTDETRAQGLMFRKSMPEDAGMLFLFPDLSQQGFWMKNTLISLDILWLNERKEVVYFVTAPPCRKDPCATYAPLQKAMYVLELNAGMVKRHNIKIGSRFEFAVPVEIRDIK